MIPNRATLPLDSVETMAETGFSSTLKAAARETGNWSLLRVLQAMALDAEEARNERRKRICSQTER